MAATMDGIMSAIFSCIPAAPSSAVDACLSADFSSRFPGGGGEDRISRLPDKLLSDIVSRLPVKDAARTSAISPRWRRLRLSTPLVLADVDIFHDHDHDGHIDWRGLASTVSRILSGHQGPIRGVHLTALCNYAAARDGTALARWLHLFAAKAVEDLVLVNFPNWPFKTTLPAEALRVASLRRLYLGLWDKFPDTDHLPGGGGGGAGAHVFPHLLELGLCRTDIKGKDLDRLLQCSPVLEKLALVLSYGTPRDVRVRSRSLRCVLFWMSIADELDVAVAPRLERLILWNDCPGACFSKNFRTTVKIGNTPLLKVLGYLDPSIHVLHIRNTVIEFGTKASPATTVPSVKILGLTVRFGMHRETKALPTFLRCFPKVETLHVMSAEADEPTGKLNFKFWQDVAPLQCLQSHIKKVVFKNFHGYRSELAFLRFIMERAQLLKKMVVVLADDSKDGVAEKLKPLACSTKRATRDPKFIILVRKGGSPWSFRVASDLSKCDPFDC